MTGGISVCQRQGERKYMFGEMNLILNDSADMGRTVVLEAKDDLKYYVDFFFFLGPHLRHMGVPRLGVQLDSRRTTLQPERATWDPSHDCDLHHSSLQHWILKPLGKATDQTRLLMDTSRVL